MKRINETKFKSLITDVTENNIHTYHDNEGKVTFTHQMFYTEDNKLVAESWTDSSDGSEDIYKGHLTIPGLLECIVNAMVEAATASIIDNRMVDEINELRDNGFNTRDLFDIRGHVFISERWDLLPLSERIAFFDKLA